MPLSSRFRHWLAGALLALALPAATAAAPIQQVELPPVDDKKQEALDLVMATIEDLFEERGQEEKVWASMVKQTIKRRKPGFNESYHGFRTFGQLLEEAQARHLLELEMDEKSGSYIVKSFVQED